MDGATSSSQSAFAIFILHAEPDTEFVRGFLLRAIGMAEADPRLMLPSKYVLGRPILEELRSRVGERLPSVRAEQMDETLLQALGY